MMASLHKLSRSEGAVRKQESFVNRYSRMVVCIQTNCERVLYGQTGAYLPEDHFVWCRSNNTQFVYDTL
jgi:hypothetical protein